LNDMAKNLVLWLVIAAVLLTIFNNFSTEVDSRRISYSDFVEEVQSGRVDRVVVDGYTIEGTRQNGERFETVRPAISDPKLIDDLLQNNVAVEGSRASGRSCWSHPSRSSSLSLFLCSSCARCRAVAVAAEARCLSASPKLR
jgi:cell division protease FtsH